jgi:lysozyme
MVNEDLRTSDVGRDEIESHEGRRLQCYDDGYGFQTIGIGHLVKPGESFPNGLTDAECEDLFTVDLMDAEAIIHEHVQVPLTQSQFDALVSFVFNVGPGRKDRPGHRGKDGFVTLRTGRPSTMLRKLNEGDYLGAAAEFTQWTKSAGRESRGLMRRRERERNLFLLGTAG